MFFEKMFSATMVTMGRDQPKKRDFSQKRIKMSQVMSENHLSADIAFAENPDAIFSFPSDAVQIQVRPKC